MPIICRLRGNRNILGTVKDLILVGRNKANKDLTAT